MVVSSVDNFGTSVKGVHYWYSSFTFLPTKFSLRVFTPYEDSYGAYGKPENTYYHLPYTFFSVGDTNSTYLYIILLVSDDVLTRYNSNDEINVSSVLETRISSFHFLVQNLHKYASRRFSVVYNSSDEVHKDNKHFTI